jgi:hypothetical protein
VTDETPKKRTRRPRPSSADGAPPASGSASPGAEDPDAALRRLESMGGPGAAPEPAGLEPMPAAPVIDSYSGPPPARQPRPVSGSKRTPRTRTRPRPAGGSHSTRMVARIAAPIVFLVAVIALVGIVVQSGVMSSDTPAPTPTVKATKTSTGTTTTVTKKYVVQSGDSLSSIAQRFGTTTSEILVLNPDLSGSTVVVGQRLVVPRQ